VSRIIGSAADFYRIRVRFIDTTDPVDFEWREDVLYRSAEPVAIEEEGEYLVEALFLGENRVAQVLERFTEASSASAYAADREGDLKHMTRSQFQDHFFAEDALAAARVHRKVQESADSDNTSQGTPVT